LETDGYRVKDTNQPPPDKLRATKMTSITGMTMVEARAARAEGIGLASLNK
jgi:hypothetical protein